MSTEKIVAPTDLRDYLKAQGWTVLEAAIKDRLYVLENKKFPQRQLAYPMDMTAPDYRESLDRVFWKLGDITGQKLENVLTRVQTLKDDVLRLRVFFDGNDSSLPLGFAATLT